MTARYSHSWTALKREATVLLYLARLTLNCTKLALSLTLSTQTSPEELYHDQRRIIYNWAELATTNHRQ